jgi:hypothetical protein
LKSLSNHLFKAKDYSPFLFNCQPTSRTSLFENSVQSNATCPKLFKF